MSISRQPGERSVRALRGATTVARNERAAIITGTAELLRAVMERNGVRDEDLISMIFTATPDISAAFPATAARDLGLAEVPLLCSVEIGVRDAIPLCVRVLIHVNTTRAASELRHVYLRGARGLRSDLDV
jgi:chorismate mutase